MSADRDVATERWEGREGVLYAALAAALAVDTAFLLEVVLPTLRPLTGGLALSAVVFVCVLLVLFAVFTTVVHRISGASS